MLHYQILRVLKNYLVLSNLQLSDSVLFRGNIIICCRLLENS